MSRPLTLDDLHAIRHMLRAGFRFTQIARELDLAVGTISRIASDRKLRRHKHVDEADLPEDDPPPDYVASNLRRCPGCGAMVYLWPCLACRMVEQGVAPRLPTKQPGPNLVPVLFLVESPHGAPGPGLVPANGDRFFSRDSHETEPRS